MSRQWRSGGAVVTALMAVGFAVASAFVPPRVHSIRTGAAVEVRPRPTLGYRVTPELEPLLTPEAALERRLAAFAREVEAKMPEGPGPDVEFGAALLADRLQPILAPIQKRARVSIHVRDLNSGQTVFDLSGDQALIPASNQKLLTSAAAIDLLGPDYEFETLLLVEGDRLYLVGTGDPLLSADDLRKMASDAADLLDVSSMSAIVVDDTAFSARRLAPGFSAEGPGVSYQAPSGALSLNFNTVAITVYPVAGSQRPGVRVDPPSPHVRVDNRARTGKGVLNVSTGEPSSRGYRDAPRDERRTEVRVRGKLGEGSVFVRRRVVDPALFCGGAFSNMLAEHSGTQPLPVVVGTAPDFDRAELVTLHRSPPLIEVVDGALAYSNNFVAEQLLRTLGWRLTKDPGDWDNGSAVLRGYWAALGNDPSALAFENGSGMSREGRVSSSSLVDLIAVAHRTRGGLLDALPVAGEEGTVEARLRNSGKRVRAKTGTLAGVSGLTGVITREDGTPQLAFSILINAVDPSLTAPGRRAVEDQVVLTVLDHIDAWETRRLAEEFEDLLVEGQPPG